MAVNLDSDSLTGEDSLLDCSLLSNPAADLLDEFAPIAISAQAHKGKLPLGIFVIPVPDVLTCCRARASVGVN